MSPLHHKHIARVVVVVVVVLVVVVVVVVVVLVVVVVVVDVVVTPGVLYLTYIDINTCDLYIYNLFIYD